MLTTIAALLLLAHPLAHDDLGKIAFVSDRDGNDEIYTMNADGSDVKRLTFNGAHDTEPCWSPDGSRIAWASDRTGDWDIWVMNADGSDQADLTQNKDRQETNPMWSVDPEVITFVSNKRIYSIKPTGDNMQQMFDMAVPDLCAPSMTRTDLKFVLRRADGQLLIKQGYDTNILVKITYGANGVPKLAYNPAWNSDASDIAFDSGGDHPKIFIVDAQDFTCDPLVFQGDGSEPVFGHGDDSIIFTEATADGKGSDICSTDIDAIHKVHGLPQPTFLTHNAGHNMTPAFWEPKDGG